MEELKRLKFLIACLGYAKKSLEEMYKRYNDQLSLREQIEAKKVLGLPLTAEEKSFLRAVRRMEK